MSATCDTRPTVLIGLPYAAAGPLADALVGEVADVLNRRVVSTFMDVRREAPSDVADWMDRNRPTLMDEIDAALRR